MTEIKKIIILGAGGHAKVVINALRSRGVSLHGATSADRATIGQNILDICPVIGSDDIIAQMDPERTLLVNGLGMIAVDSSPRKEIFERWKARGFSFEGVVHPSTVIAKDVVLGEGAQVMAGAVIQPGTVIGANTIVNTSASIDHDCVIGAHCHIAPGAVLAGGISIGEGTFIGAGATIIPGVRVGSAALVAAGAVVVSEVGDKVRVRGIPARSYP